VFGLMVLYKVVKFALWIALWMMKVRPPPRRRLAL
jgi:hypothetical protein